MNTRLARFYRLTALTTTLFVTVTHNDNQAEITNDHPKFGAAWQSADCATFKLAALVAALPDCGYVIRTWRPDPLNHHLPAVT
jgi:hypothetical protein